MAKEAMVCLISKEAMANALPVLEYRPEMVFLAATSEQTRNAGYLKEFFAKKGIPSEIVSGMDAYHPEPNKQVMANLFNRYPDYSFTLNSTGGTKIMSLAAYEAFSSSGKKVIYCNTPGREIITLPEGRVDKTLTVQLSAEDYLTSYGYSIDEMDLKPPVKEYEPLLNELKEAVMLKEFITLSDNVKKLKAAVAGGIAVSSKKNKFRLQKKERQYILTWGGGHAINFSSLRFCEGTWLEELAFHFMNNHNRNCLASMHIFSPDKNKNEVDLLYVKDHMLNLVSAKSGPFNKLDLFELHGLQVLAGGIMARPVILHVGQISKADEKRAREMRIEPVSVFELHKLL
ncbi:MAG: hypothetical protein FMNOHCHN_01498 [Ignavibacteriaceae bacterium]|nr:hypothetical protein [Ignavibacteriaceae bacterium]